MSRARRHVLLIAVFASILAGVWLRHEALTIGFHGDDYVQSGMLHGRFPAPRSAFDLFRFADVERDGTAVIDFGYQPWWSASDLKIAMFRPLSSALIALDHRLFGPNPVAHHVHSFLWWGLLVVACAWLYKSVFPVRVAAVGVALFAVEEAHTVPLAWLANRSTLVAATFGLVALGLHIRKEKSPSYRAAEGLAFTLALLSGEYGASILAYVLAFQVLGARGGFRERLRALIPVVSATGIAVLGAAVFGFGVRSSGYYVSPLESPREFVAAAIERAPILAGDLIWSIPAAWWVDGMPWTNDFVVGRNWQRFLGWAALLAFAAGVRIVEARHGKKYAALRWLCAGAVLSLLPSAAALPEDRTLVAAAVGTSALFAVLIVTGYDAVRERLDLRALLPGLIGLAVLLLHVAEAWDRSADQLQILTLKVRAQRRWALEADIPDATAAQSDVIIVTGGDFTTIANLPWVRLAHGHPLPRSYTRLSGAVHVHDVERTAPNVIELAVLSNALEDTMVGSLYRSRTDGFRPGDVVTLPRLRVEVLRTEGIHPWRTRLTFPRSLDDPSYLFLHSTPEGIRRFEMPPLGGKLRLLRPAPPRP